MNTQNDSTSTWTPGLFEVRVLLVAMLTSGILLTPLVMVLLRVIQQRGEPAPFWVGTLLGIIWSYPCFQLARGRTVYLDVQAIKALAGKSMSRPRTAIRNRQIAFVVAALVIGAPFMWVSWEIARRILAAVYHVNIAEMAFLFPVPAPADLINPPPYQTTGAKASVSTLGRFDPPSEK